MNYALVCLDETGSMRGQEERVVSSLNEYVAGLPEHTHVTVFKFDALRWDTFFDNYKKNWIHMTTEDYKPGSMTPLLDSIARTIRHAESITSKDDKVFIMIDTDGQENASKEETRDSIKALVAQKTECKWEFWFMANSIDQITANTIGKTGHDLGMNVASNVHSARTAVYATHAGQTTRYFEKEE